ncbi:MAG: PrgI family protein [bacterium]|nr:PrgI family protein [bacterium]
MEQHSIPRQITSFEFKLIGFLTLKQFIYILVFAGAGFVAYLIFPIPLLNYVVGVLVAAVGLAFAFLPINDRPLDVWIKNLYKRLTSPTQYVFHKHNPPVYFLQNLYFATDPHHVLAHIESQEKLAQYIVSTAPVKPNTQKQNIHNLFHTANVAQPKKTTSIITSAQTTQNKPDINVVPAQNTTGAPAPSTGSRAPFFSGLIKNHKLIPIPGILIYVKNDAGASLRLLKSNPHGVFATFNPLPSAEYTFEIKDPKNTYLFDTIKLKIEAQNPKPFEFLSKEML